MIQRYREVHDMLHTLLGMPTNILGECHLASCLESGGWAEQDAPASLSTGARAGLACLCHPPIS